MKATTTHRFSTRLIVGVVLIALLLVLPPAPRAAANGPATRVDPAYTPMAEEDVAIDDLWAVAKPQLNKLQIPRNVHFHAAGSAVLAKQVAQSIQTLVATTEITWEDGQQQKLHSLERPQLFFEDNQPAVLLFASDTGSKREHSFNVRIPLGTPQ